MQLNMLYLILVGSILLFMACGKNGDRKSQGREQGEEISSAPTSAIALAGGGTHVCALMNNNHLKCWGGNRHGQLDMHLATNASGQIIDASKKQFSQITVGQFHSCGILQGSSQTGIPICFGKQGPWLNVPKEKIRYIAAGGDFTCFIKENDTLGCVGQDVLISISKLDMKNVKASDLPKYGIGVGSGEEYLDYSNKIFKNIKAWTDRICGQAEDDIVYCMGDNIRDAGISKAEKAIDYALGNFSTLILSHDKKVLSVPVHTQINKIANLANPAELKYKNIFSSISGIVGYLTDAGNTYDDGTPIAENSLLIISQKPFFIEKVSDMASNRGGPDPNDMWGYCVLKTNGKVSCDAVFSGGAPNPNSPVVQNIPPEIAE